MSPGAYLCSENSQLEITDVDVTFECTTPGDCIIQCGGVAEVIVMAVAAEEDEASLRVSGFEFQLGTAAYGAAISASYASLVADTTSQIVILSIMEEGTI